MNDCRKYFDLLKFMETKLNCAYPKEHLSFNKYWYGGVNISIVWDGKDFVYRFELWTPYEASDYKNLTYNEVLEAAKKDYGYKEFENEKIC